MFDKPPTNQYDVKIAEIRRQEKIADVVFFKEHKEDIKTIIANLSKHIPTDGHIILNINGLSIRIDREDTTLLI